MYCFCANNFGLQPPFLVASSGVFSQAKKLKVAAKLLNWLGSQGHRGHLFAFVLNTLLLSDDKLFLIYSILSFGGLKKIPYYCQLVDSLPRTKLYQLVRYIFWNPLLSFGDLCTQQPPCCQKGQKKSESNSWNLGQSHLSTGSGAEGQGMGTHWMTFFNSFKVSHFKCHMSQFVSLSFVLGKSVEVSLSSTRPISSGFETLRNKEEQNIPSGETT